MAAKHNIMYNNYKTTGYKYKTCKNLLQVNLYSAFIVLKKKHVLHAQLFMWAANNMLPITMI